MVRCTAVPPGQNLTATGQGSAVGVVDAVVGSSGAVDLVGVRATTVPGPASVHVVARDGPVLDETLATTVGVRPGDLPFSGGGRPGLGAGLGAVAGGAVLLAVGSVLVRRRLGHTHREAPPRATRRG